MVAPFFKNNGLHHDGKGDNEYSISNITHEAPRDMIRNSAPHPQLFDMRPSPLLEAPHQYGGLNCTGRLNGMLGAGSGFLTSSGEGAQGDSAEDLN